MVRIVITEQPEALLDHDDDVVQQSLKLDSTDQYAQVDGLLLAAQAELDGPKGWVGISVAQQSAEVRYDTFDCEPLRLPGGPIIGAPVVKYLAADGTLVTLDTSAYVVLSDGIIAAAAGAQWPGIANQNEAVRITYDVGIQDESDPRIQLMKTAIILHAKMTLDFDDVDTRRRAIEGLVRPMWVPVL